MPGNNCKFVRERLSAFYDGELTGREAAEIDLHLRDCQSCQAELRRFESLSASLAETSPSGAPELWPQIESEFAKQKRTAPALRNLSGWNSRSPQAVGAMAAAALLLVAVGVWLVRETSTSEAMTSRQAAGAGEKHGGGHQHDPMGMSDQHMEQFVGVMDRYLSELPSDPDTAEDFLLAQYQGAKISPDEAATLVGYRPIIAGGLPDGYSLASSSVLRMPCCTCFKAVCRRGDGSTLVLFEHDDEETAWFGDRPSGMAMCGEKNCCLVQLDSSIAATWQQGSRSVTAVGLKDQQEVTTLVNWLGRQTSVRESGDSATRG